MAEMGSQQNQQTAILCQIQQHLGLLPPPQPDLPVKDTIPQPLAQIEDTIPEPLAPVEDTIPEPLAPVEDTIPEPLASIEDTIPAEDITTTEVQILPPQKATIDAIALVDPQDEPQTVDTVTTTPEDASSPHEAPTT